ncbi:MAG: SpoVG family protein [Bacteroidaceae bacterium]|nr:SpoVG family protein [Bacteroidaceae bacterium]
MAKKEVKTEKAFECLSVTSVQVFPFRDGARCGNILGLANVVLNDQLFIRGLRVMDGVNGMFVGYPNDPFYKGEDLRSVVFPMTRALREHIENCVLEKYQYETENATVKFEVELTHRDLSGAALQMEIIATSEKKAESKAKARAIEIIPATKESKEEWVILKVEKHE